MRLGLMVLRLLVGGLFFGHGMQKLAGWFGGYGLDATGEAFDGMGLKPGKAHATAAGIAEAGGGALLVAGAATPLAASMITGTMTVAIERVHGDKGPWVTDGGWEYNAVLIAAVFALAAAGPGALALDGADGPRGAGWALAQLAAGVGGGLATVNVFADGASGPAQHPGDSEPASAQTQPVT